MDKRSIAIDDKEVKRTIIIETARQQSFLVGCFSKPRIPGIVINQWVVASVSNPKFLEFISKEMVKILKEVGETDLLCGIETAGIGIASAVSLASGIPWIYARKERKNYGSLEAFEGTYYKGAHVVFIDNMSSKGKGMPEVFRNAEEEGFEFHDQIVIVDNAWEKVAEYDKYDIKIHSLITTRELIDGLNSLHYFPNNLYYFLDNYFNDPKGWKPGSKIVEEFVKELKNAPDLPYLRKDTCTG